MEHATLVQQETGALLKDVFISYARKESLCLAARLHQHLVMRGMGVWFDKVNIPAADDFQERIKAGIRDAQNFIFVMTPSSLTSPYCYSELEYAASCGKRIIPLVHIEETKEQKAAYTEEQRINRERSWSIVGKRNWVFAREAIGDLAELKSWQNRYEGQWLRHKQTDYLKEWQCPVQWEARDHFGTVIEKLVDALGQERQYVKTHTSLLLKAYEWDKKGRFTEDLLVGKERQDAEEWLVQDFHNELPPCEPTDLHARYICASKKNARNLMTDVFISYSVKNKGLMDDVMLALERKAVTTWLHSHDIDKAKQYPEEINLGIEQADNFLFFLSAEAIASDWCLRELRYAYNLNKRIIPLKVGAIEQVSLPEDPKDRKIVEHLLGLQFVDFTDNVSGRVDEMGKSDFEKDVDAILREVNRDKEYYQQHKVLLVQALRWQRNPQPAFLLNGHNLEKANTWLRLNGEREENPPCALHLEFIQTSEQSKGAFPSEVFISYSRKDSDFARKLNQKLQATGRFTWFDQESIASGVDFDQEIFKGIEKAHNFLFVISPDSVSSSFCERELQHAAQHHKRFIPVLWRETGQYEGKLPKDYLNTQWIDFSSQDFDRAFQDLNLLLDTDREHVEEHVRWQQRAMEWKSNKQSQDYLLNASACEAANDWLDKASISLPKIDSEAFVGQFKSDMHKVGIHEKAFHWLLHKFPMFWRYLLALLAFLVYNILYFALPLQVSSNLKVNMVFLQTTFAIGLGFVMLKYIAPLEKQKPAKPKRESFGNRLWRLTKHFWVKASKVVFWLLCGLAWAINVVLLAEMNILGGEGAFSKIQGDEFEAFTWIFLGYFIITLLVWIFSRKHTKLRKAFSMKAKSDEAAKDVENVVVAGKALWNELIAQTTKSPKPTTVQLSYIYESSRSLARAEAKEKVVSDQLKQRLRNVNLALASSALIAGIAIYVGVIANRHADTTGQLLEHAITLMDGHLDLHKMKIIYGTDSYYLYDGAGEPVAIDDFYMAVNEVTWVQYEVFCLKWNIDFANLEFNDGMDVLNPATYVSWLGAINYCNWLSIEKGLQPVYYSERPLKDVFVQIVEGEPVKWDRKANGYRLPTEAEWEYAATMGMGVGEFQQSAYFKELMNKSSFGIPQKVKSFMPNGFGIYDIVDNAREWCYDSGTTDLYEQPTFPHDELKGRNPVVEDPGTGSHIVRGGEGFYEEDQILMGRYAYDRYYLNSDISFRMVRNAD